MARSVRTATWTRRTTRRSLVRIAIRRQPRTGPECRILAFARHHPHAGSIHRLGATTVIRTDAGPNSRTSARSVGARAPWTNPCGANLAFPTTGTWETGLSETLPKRWGSTRSSYPWAPTLATSITTDSWTFTYGLAVPETRQWAPTREF